MKTPPKPKKVVAPEGCEDYLTAGKEYDCFEQYDYIQETGWFFKVLSDDGDELYTREKGTVHLTKSFSKGADRIVTEYEKP